MHQSTININDYTYQLPNERIAEHPIEPRDEAKLLLFNNGNVTTSQYKNLGNHLPANSILFFNNTKVIKARLFFKKENGGNIEIFLLEPYKTDYSVALSASTTCTWKCLVGGAAKWKEKYVFLQLANTTLQASIYAKDEDTFIINFEWAGGENFAAIIDAAGNIPLPPYIKRQANNADTNSYQTVYAQHEGSVAAPTAGLHFTSALLNNLKAQGCILQYVTLHVGAGTFKPVKTTVLANHTMHAEWIDVDLDTIIFLQKNIQQPIVAIGTTSVRTLETLYWLGVKVYLNPSVTQLTLTQWEVYEAPLNAQQITATTALQALVTWLQKNHLKSVVTNTQILIAPGYVYKIVSNIVTNFHQPQSTLLLLVAAAIGNNWLNVYNYALQNNYRFLSYGDGCLLPTNKL
jgi:S-adenosylmethionine:tRNA ribosyltransferase-isomerase